MNKKDQAGFEKSQGPVLFVDDEPVTHRLVDALLKGWDVRHAYSGAEALKILDDENIHIVLSDIGMPGMDGITMLREIKRRRGTTQVIILTASEDVGDLINALEAGANDFLLKPLRKESILAALTNTTAKIDRWKSTMRELFNRKRGTDEVPERSLNASM